MLKKLRIRITFIFIMLCLVPLIVLSGSTWPETAPFIPPVLFLAGILLVGVGTLGRLWCSAYIAGRKSVELITQGPYSLCGNPLYLCSFIGAVGVGLASETLTIPILISIGFTVSYPFIIKKEEEKLKKLHKGKYEIYLKQVPRFVPGFFHLAEPQEYIVKAIVFRKHLFQV